MSKTAKASGAACIAQEMQVAKRESITASVKTETYSVEELIAASETALHVPKECAAAAFKFQKAEKLTLSEAQSIVEKFMKKEVK